MEMAKLGKRGIRKWLSSIDEKPKIRTDQQAVSELEEQLAENLRQDGLAKEQVAQWSDPVPSVIEEEPMSDPIETKMEDAESSLKIKLHHDQI